ARKGFRGWSGSARREFVITADSATPGYVPGIIQPGTWQVILGLHRIPADGCRYRVEVVLDEPVVGASGGVGAPGGATSPFRMAQGQGATGGEGLRGLLPGDEPGPPDAAESAP